MKKYNEVEYILDVPYYSADWVARKLGRSVSNILLHARMKHIKSIMHKGGKFFRMEWVEAFVKWLENR